VPLEDVQTQAQIWGKDLIWRSFRGGWDERGGSWDKKEERFENPWPQRFKTYSRRMALNLFFGHTANKCCKISKIDFPPITCL